MFVNGAFFSGRHAPATGLALLALAAAPSPLVIPAQAGIQYAAAYRLNHYVSGILDQPPEPVIGRRKSADPVAGDDG